MIPTTCYTTKDPLVRQMVKALLDFVINCVLFVPSLHTELNTIGQDCSTKRPLAVYQNIRMIRQGREHKSQRL